MLIYIFFLIFLIFLVVFTYVNKKLSDDETNKKPKP